MFEVPEASIPDVWRCVGTTPKLNQGFRDGNVVIGDEHNLHQISDFWIVVDDFPDRGDQTNDSFA